MRTQNGVNARKTLNKMSRASVRHDVPFTSSDESHMKTRDMNEAAAELLEATKKELDQRQRDLDLMRVRTLFGMVNTLDITLPGGIRATKQSLYLSQTAASA